MMEEHECYIGIWFDYEHDELITFKELEEKVKDVNETYEYAKDTYGFDFVKGLIRKVKLRDYFDRRKNTNLRHFDYCPDCGNKIDWKKMKKEYENENQDKK